MHGVGGPLLCGGPPAFCPKRSRRALPRNRGFDGHSAQPAQIPESYLLECDLRTVLCLIHEGAVGCAILLSRFAMAGVCRGEVPRTKNIEPECPNMRNCALS